MVYRFGYVIVLTIGFLLGDVAMTEGASPSYEVIYLGGPSSSGKSTLAKALQDRFDDPFLHICIDKMIGLMRGLTTTGTKSRGMGG